MKKKLIHMAGKCLSAVSPRLASHYWYYGFFKKPLSLRAPVTLNEKLLWLKLNTYRHNPLVTECADKYLVRNYLEKKGCAHLLNELYGVWDRAEDIDWDALPNSFVLKCNHGCGYNILCPDKSKLDIPATVKLLDQWMHTDFWRDLAEMQYEDIPKKIVCEAFLGHGDELLDYKIYCFHGKPLYILVCSQRESGDPKFYFFDHNWNFCPITHDGKEAPEGFTLDRPSHLEEMLHCAEQLSEPFPFVRVDFYHVDNRVVFGELTFVPSGGLDTSRLHETDLLFGSLLRLPFEETK